MQRILNQKLIDSGDLEESDEDEDEEDTDSSTHASTRKKGRIPKSVGSPSHGVSSNTVVSRTNRIAPAVSLKKKLLSLHEFLVGFTYDDHQPMALFMEKPSKKLYPDYYQVIQHPIDMTTIENNIKADRYSTIDDIVGDYRLMFSNCRKYNEEGSMIYEDANILEKALNEKLKEFSGISKKLNIIGKM